MATKALWLTAIGFPAVISSPAVAQDEVGWWHDGWGHMAYDGLFMVLIWGGFLVLAIFLTRYLFRQRDSRSSNEGAGSSPLDILAERFARGEIDESEYEARRRVLTSHS